MTVNDYLVEDYKIKVVSINTVVVGSGASGLNAAGRLFDYGQKDICIITEGMKMGTSRNTGSDKQTYYKISTSGMQADSAYEMAKTLFEGGSMDGDIALCEATGSLKSFYHLVDLGVPFPHNRFGEFPGYQTDHDVKKRATSAGPLTSKYMTESLEGYIINKGIKVFDNTMVVKIIVKDKKAIGLIAIDLSNIEDEIKFTLFNCKNIVYATGGPAGIFLNSVYPESQTGMSGIAMDAGLSVKNILEFQFGIGSIKFRWNLSGTYQQVVPRYVSTDMEGNDEREFLDEYFSSPQKLVNAIFLKGYQWPFDPRKIKDEGSSLIDIGVYNEINKKGRRVFLDFSKNPKCSEKNGKFDFSLLYPDNFAYLKNSNELEKNPYKRLEKMNQKAIELYMNNAINIENEILEIDICPQHNNGGLSANIWWESNIKHIFPVGEVNGSHGIYRPGGSALNSGQVGADRAAMYISKKYMGKPLNIDSFLEICNNSLIEIMTIIETAKKKKSESRKHIIDYTDESKKEFSKAAGIIRNHTSVKETMALIREKISSYQKEAYIRNNYEIPILFKMTDMHISQYVCLYSICDYIEKYGYSRGSYIIENEDENRNKKDKSKGEIQEIFYKNQTAKAAWRSVRPIPLEDTWFEKVWQEFESDKIY